MKQLHLHLLSDSTGETLDIAPRVLPHPISWFRARVALLPRDRDQLAIGAGPEERLENRGALGARGRLPRVEAGQLDAAARVPEAEDAALAQVRVAFRGDDASADANRTGSGTDSGVRRTTTSARPRGRRRPP